MKTFIKSQVGKILKLIWVQIVTLKPCKNMKWKLVIVVKLNWESIDIGSKCQINVGKNWLKVKIVKLMWGKKCEINLGKNWKN